MIFFTRFYLAVVVFLAPLVALAEELAAPTGLSRAEIIDYAIMTLGLPLIAALGRVVQLGIAWLTAKTKTTLDDRMGEKVGGLAMLAVKSTYQAYVKPLKEQGKWTPESHDAAKKMALEELKSYLGAKGLKELAGNFGGDVAALLTGAVEAAVHDNKRSGAVAAAITDPRSPTV